ncbi:Dicer-like protein 1 [Cladophialophora chaetospira]|uniref:Dicer-like protein 1 n=1 Tax=Cladophialophora chaetospira TaxID=386627 RepID=A0AA38XH58_9EURO|nr:Dicer-like protein 1 [Cladophialophora chaetospira]
MAIHDSAVDVAATFEANLEQPEDDYLTESDNEVDSHLSSTASQADLNFNKAILNNYVIAHANGGTETRTARQIKNDESNKIIDQAREYQQELFDRAKEENIIAVLDTGSGKTLIAALLIRHHLQQEIIDRSQGKPHKIVFFLVNSVHLARQQARFLSNNLPERVVPLFGGTSDDLWKKAEWNRIFAENSVVVCTAAVLDSCLMHSYLTIGQISLLVFDEAHHCKKNHPYSRIVRDFYLKWKGDKPRIFGMTASPVDSRRDIEKVVEDLEGLLQSKIVTTNDLSVFEFAPRAKDAIWYYTPLDAEYETELFSALMPLCGFVSDLKPYFTFARMASKHLGTWVADRIWHYALPTSEHESANIVRKYERSDAYVQITDPILREASLNSVHEAIAVVSRHTFAAPKVDEDRELSTKVRKLYEELRDRFAGSATTRSIVFVEERLTAMVLCDLFAMLALPNVRPGVLVGVAQSGKEGGSWKDQESVMEKFRAGIINVIFATNVAEEGIDIPQCNLVVRFDLYKTPIAYMQSRGRARMKDSIFAHMIEEHNQSQQAEVDYAIAQDDYIRRYCRQLPPTRLLGQGSKLKQLISRDASCQSFVTSTGVLANYNNALLLLTRYTESLKKVGATSSEIYEQMIDTEESMFQYKVILPPTDDERTAAVKGAKGEPRTNKAWAKQAAAWHCVFKLRKNNLLDENLDSIFFKVKPANLNARIAVSEKKDDYEKKVKPDFWLASGATSSTVPTELFVTHVRVGPRSSSWLSDGVLLMTRAPLPAIPAFSVYVDDNIEKQVEFQPFNQPVAVTPDEVEALTTYTLRGIFHDIFNKQYAHMTTSMSYWLAPPASMDESSTFKHIVNMEELLAASASERGRWKPGNHTKKWCNAFLVDPGSGKFRYFTDGIVPGKTIFDATPDSAKSVKKKYDRTIIEYSDSTWRAKTKAFEKEKYDPHQPVLSAKVIVAGRYYVERLPPKEQRFAYCHLAPQPLEVARISYAVAQTGVLWPSILHRLESLLIVQDAYRKLDLEEVPLNLALEAFTQDGSSEADLLGSETGSQAEQDFDEHDAKPAEKAPMNYERLEFIGDSLLKMMTTITVYNRTTCNEEGMHCKRMDLLSNSRLCNTASAPHYELFRYIRSAGENWRDTWYPEFLERQAGKNKGRIVKLTDKHRKHALGKKTIADVCEATIGACIMTSQHLPTEEKFDLGIKAITKFVEHADHDINSWVEVLPMYKPAAWVREPNDPIANDYANKIYEVTGYQFKNPRLVRSAFTHSSDQNSPVQDLQRLEFLGDACLDWVCIWWLFSTNPTRDPHWLTEHKMAMVSNKFLAALAVILGFNKLVYATSPAVYDEIGSYARKVQEAWADPDVKPDFWTKVITGSNVPKVLADLVESYLGAVLVDSGFDFREIEKFFEKHVKWHFQDIEAYDTFANRHPTTYLVKLLTQEFRCRKAVPTQVEGPVQLTTDASRDHEDDDEDEAGGAKGDDAVGGVMCHVAWMVHGKIVAVSKGTGVKYAKVRASKAALKILGKLKVDEFRKEWGCDCQTGKERKASLADVSVNGGVDGDAA